MEPTKEASFRLLTLEGECGAVFCRVHDKKAMGTIPRLSEKGNWEFATRSLMRMVNLSVFRGRDRSASMVGPGDYFCNIEEPDASSFTIEFEDLVSNGAKILFPRFVPHPPVSLNTRSNLRPLSSQEFVCVPATWFSGKDHATLAAKKKQYSEVYGIKDCFGGSLFPEPGLLEIDITSLTDSLLVSMPFFNATEVDLTPYKARLVPNNVPFQITDKKLLGKDEFRPVSYDFGENYWSQTVANGGGLFLETHDFTQTMTPLDVNARGFILLGKWTEESLDLVAVRIPFGWTLLVDSGCIHGDTTFVGQYMMSMTSNHVTMNSADTVFLKDAVSKKNIAFACPEHFENVENVSYVPRPIILFDNPTATELTDFKTNTEGAKFMLQPFSKISWWSTLYRRLGWFPGMPSE